MDTGRGASHTGVCWEAQRCIESWGGITWGEMPEIGDEGMEAANHIAMYVPMQQSCMFCTGTPETKVQLIIIIIIIIIINQNKSLPYLFHLRKLLYVSS